MTNLFSALIGALIAIMIMLNGTLANAFGNYPSTVLIHIVGLLPIIFLLLINKCKIRIVKGTPIYLYSAGAIGVFTVLFNNLSFPVLGISITLALGLLGQSVSSIIIDHFGLMGMEVIKFEKKKFIGLIFIILGILIMAIF